MDALRSSSPAVSSRRDHALCVPDPDHSTPPPQDHDLVALRALVRGAAAPPPSLVPLGATPHTSRAQPHGVISAVKPSSPAVHLLSLHGRTKKQQVLVFVKATISYRPKVHDTVNYKFAIGRLTSIVSSF